MSDVPGKAREARSDARRNAQTTANRDAHDNAKRYDAAYFEKWYRDPEHRVRTPAEFARQVDFVLHLTEWVLERKLTRVLDVGCGEGQWGVALRKRRPRLSYVGIDPSDWAVSVHGARRGVRQGGITDLDRLLTGEAPFDLVLCVGMLNYLDAGTLRTGLRQVASHCAGMAYLELFAQGDEYVGDTDWPKPKPAAWYRTLLQSSGFVPIGMQCYVTRDDADRISALERG